MLAEYRNEAEKAENCGVLSPYLCVISEKYPCQKGELLSEPEYVARGGESACAKITLASAQNFLKPQTEEPAHIYCLKMGSF